MTGEAIGLPTAGSTSALQRLQCILILVTFTSWQTSALQKPFFPCESRGAKIYSSRSCNNQIHSQQYDSYCRSRLNNILSVVSTGHAKDVAASLQTNILAEHTLNRSSKETAEIPFKWWDDDVSVIETTTPVLSDKSRQIILQSALKYWEEHEETESLSEDSKSGENSRFTLQGPNKREVRASGLSSEAIETINEALGSTYSMLRNAFGKQVVELHHNQCDDEEESPAHLSKKDWSLLLYDALVIEYDATSAEQLLPVSERPAQPLHRDLGLFSVNIALDDPSNFEGGGTVFERRFPMDEHFDGTDTYESLASPTPCSILPRAAGYAVAHPCRERHAGGALISGRRTILVLFVTGAHVNDQPSSERSPLENSNTDDEDVRVKATPSNSCPKLEISARCKSLGMTLGGGSTIPVPSVDSLSSPPLNGKEDQILCYRAAVESDPTDGEAWLYLGMGLMSKPPCDSLQDQLALSEEIIECLDRAQEFNPTDGRVFNTLGIALQQHQQLLEFAAASEPDQRSSSPKDNDGIRIAFAKAATLHKHAAHAGCMGAAVEARSALLNWGLWHANRDEFEMAVPILRQICVDGIVADTSSKDLEVADDDQHNLDVREYEAKRTVRDAKSLLAFCEKQLKQKS